MEGGAMIRICILALIFCVFVVANVVDASHDVNGEEKFQSTGPRRGYGIGVGHGHGIGGVHGGEHGHRVIGGHGGKHWHFGRGGRIQGGHYGFGSAYGGHHVGMRRHFGQGQESEELGNGDATANGKGVDAQTGGEIAGNDYGVNIDGAVGQGGGSGVGTAGKAAAAGNNNGKA